VLQRDAVQKLKFDAACAANSGKSADPILHRESPLLKNRNHATGPQDSNTRNGMQDSNVSYAPIPSF
jgi:hypothetical protein